MEEYARPEVIEAGDPILTPTLRKLEVDLETHACRFQSFLQDALRLPSWATFLKSSEANSRSAYREHLISYLTARRGLASKERPQLVFVGGGYGSGKTTIIHHMAQSQALPVGPGFIVGADIVKLHIPEYGLIASVGDGRASATAQDECKVLAERIFQNLVTKRSSFIWDSSMSDLSVTKDRIEAASASGYELTLVGVLTPEKVAMRQAMRRAKWTRRFPNPKALIDSHREFRRNLPEYLEIFDEVRVFSKSSIDSESPKEIGISSGKGNGLALVHVLQYSSESAK